METATLDQGTKILALFRDAPRDQVQAVLASGLLADLRDADFNQSINREEVRKLLGLKPLNPPLLEEIGTFLVPATDSLFIARDKFVVGNAGIVYVSEQFKKQFLGKTEEPTVEKTLRYAKLTRASPDNPILAELGGKAETTLAQVCALMERQKSGEEDVMLTNGWANIFYARGINGVLWAVGVYWDGHGWVVDASSVSSPHRWRDGYRVFSSNS